MSAAVRYRTSSQCCDVAELKEILSVVSYYVEQMRRRACGDQYAGKIIRGKSNTQYEVELHH